MTNQYYNNAESRLNTVSGADDARTRFFMMLRRAKDDHGDNGIPYSEKTFRDWLSANWGFNLVLDNNGLITGEPEITDPERYLMFVLRYE